MKFALEDFLKVHRANVAKQNLQLKDKRSSSTKNQKDNRIIERAKKASKQPKGSNKPRTAPCIDDSVDEIGQLVLFEPISSPYFPVGTRQASDLLVEILNRMFAKTYPAHMQEGYSCKDHNLPCYLCKTGCEHCNNRLFTNQFCTHSNGILKSIDELFAAVKNIDPRENLILIDAVYQSPENTSKLFTVKDKAETASNNANLVGWVYTTRQNLTTKCHWRGLDLSKRQMTHKKLGEQVGNLTPELFNERHLSKTW